MSEKKEPFTLKMGKNYNWSKYFWERVSENMLWYIVSIQGRLGLAWFGCVLLANSKKQMKKF